MVLLLFLAALACAGVQAAPDVLARFAGEGPLLGEPSSHYSPSRDEAWVNRTASGYKEVRPPAYWLPRQR